MDMTKVSAGASPSIDSVRAIGFDLWETLITNSPDASRRQGEARVDRLTESLNECGMPIARDHVERAHHEVWQRCHELYWSHDVDIETRQQLVHFFELLGLDVPDDQMQHFEDVYARSMLHHPPELVDGAREVLNEIKRLGYRIGLVSNTGRTPGSVLREYLRLERIEHLFDAMVFSNELRVCKPRPTIFEALAARLGEPQHRIAFIGDNREADVFGAASCGMFAILFERATKGTAFAPESGRGRSCQPHATITTLRDLPAMFAGVTR